MSDLSAPLSIRTHIRDYEIQELVGSGGFGFVYRATDHKLQRNVAIKEYFPKFIAKRGGGGVVQPRLSANDEIYKRGLENFLIEARVLAQFDDPAVAKVHLFWEQDGTAYMVMPLYEGITLRSLVRLHRDLITVNWLTTFLQRITQALESLHKKEIYHRDLSPENILILESGGLVLLDFGSSYHHLAQVSCGEEVVLKPGYAPIEQYLTNDTLKQGAWTDLYGLGAVLHFLLEGQAPPASINRLQQDAYEPLENKQERHPGVSPNILAAIDRCLAVQPTARPQSIAQLKELMALESYSVTKDFSLFQGVQYAAASAIAVNDENEVTIPLDPVAAMPPGLEAALYVSEQSFASTSDAPALNGNATDQESRQATISDTEKNGATKVEKTLAKQQIPGKKPTGKNRSRVELFALAFAFVLVLAIGLLLYLLIAPSGEKTPSQTTASATPKQNDAADLFAIPSASQADTEALMPGLSTASGASDSAKPEADAQAPSLDTAAANVETIAPPPPTNGIVRLNIKPWGTLTINGESRGATPPLKQLKLPPGKYQIEISNPGFPSFKTELDVPAGETTIIKHFFE